MPWSEGHGDTDALPPWGENGRAHGVGLVTQGAYASHLGVGTDAGRRRVKGTVPKRGARAGEEVRGHQQRPSYPVQKPLFREASCPSFVWPCGVIGRGNENAIIVFMCVCACVPTSAGAFFPLTVGLRLAHAHTRTTDQCPTWVSSDPWRGKGNGAATAHSGLGRRSQPCRGGPSLTYSMGSHTRTHARTHAHTHARHL